MLEQIEETTGMTPKALETRPLLARELQFPYDCYSELSGTRQSAFQGMNPLTFTEFLSFSEIYDISRHEREGLWRQIKAIDVVWRRESGKWHDQIAKSKSSGKKPPAKRTAK